MSLRFEPHSTNKLIETNDYKLDEKQHFHQKELKNEKKYCHIIIRELQIIGYRQEREP